MADDSLKYWAFIFYSHRDKARGDWLHRRLETCRVPGRAAAGDMVGAPASCGTCPP